MGKILTGEEKIQKICDALKKQTIEPAKANAQEILENAKLEAKNILEQANKEAKQILIHASEDIENKNIQALSSLKLSYKKVIDQLKQEIENNFFVNNLKVLVEKKASNTSYIATCINTVLKAIEKEGIDTNIEIYLPTGVSKEDIKKELLSDVLEKLKDDKFISGDFSGGAKIKLLDQKITLDISDTELTSLISNYIRKDFRETIFGL